MSFQISGGLDKFTTGNQDNVDMNTILGDETINELTGETVTQVEIGWDMDGNGTVDADETLTGWIDEDGDLFVDTNDNGEVDGDDFYIVSAYSYNEATEQWELSIADINTAQAYDAGTGLAVDGLSIQDVLQIAMIDTIDWTNLDEAQITELLLDMNRYADAASANGSCEALIELDGDTLSITYGSGATLVIDMANATEAQLEMFAGALVSADAFGASELIDELANLGKIGTGGNYDFFVQQIMIDLVATGNSTNIVSVATVLDAIGVGDTLNSYLEAIIANCSSSDIGLLLMSGEISHSTQDALVQELTAEQLVDVLNTLSGYSLAELLDFDMTVGSYETSYDLIIDALISEAEAGNYAAINSVLLSDHLGSDTRQALLDGVSESALQGMLAEMGTTNVATLLDDVLISSESMTLVADQLAAVFGADACLVIDGLSQSRIADVLTAIDADALADLITQIGDQNAIVEKLMEWFGTGISIGFNMDDDTGLDGAATNDGISDLAAKLFEAAGTAGTSLAKGLYIQQLLSEVAAGAIDYDTIDADVLSMLFARDQDAFVDFCNDNGVEYVTYSTMFDELGLDFELPMELSYDTRLEIAQSLIANMTEEGKTTDEIIDFIGDMIIKLVSEFGGENDQYLQDALSMIYSETIFNGSDLEGLDSLTSRVMDSIYKDEDGGAAVIGTLYSNIHYDYHVAMFTDIAKYVDDEAIAAILMENIGTLEFNALNEIFSSIVDDGDGDIAAIVALLDASTIAALINTDHFAYQTALMDALISNATANGDWSVCADVLSQITYSDDKVEFITALNTAGNLADVFGEMEAPELVDLLNAEFGESGAEAFAYALSALSGLGDNAKIAAVLTGAGTDGKTGLATDTSSALITQLSTDETLTAVMNSCGVDGLADLLNDGCDTAAQALLLGNLTATDLGAEDYASLIKSVSDPATRVSILENVAADTDMAEDVILGLNGATLGSILTEDSCTEALITSICDTLQGSEAGLTLIADIINDDGSLSDDLFGSLLSGLSSEEIGSVMSQLFPSRIASGQAFMDYIQANKSAESIGEILAYCGDNQEALIDWAFTVFTNNADIGALYNGFAGESSDMTLLDSRVLEMDTSDIVEILGYLNEETASTFITTNAQTLWDNHMAGMLTDADSSVLLILCLTDDTARETISPIILESLSDTAIKADFTDFVLSNMVNQVIQNFLLSNLDNTSMKEVAVDVLKLELEGDSTDEGSLYYLLTKDFSTAKKGLYSTKDASLLKGEVQSIFGDLIVSFAADADDGAVTAPTDYDSALALLYEWNLNDHGLGGETRQMIYDLIFALINSDLAYPRPD